MRLPLYQVDAFAAQPFGGNPAAVVLLQADQSLSDAMMLKIAAEMNLSETAFVQALVPDPMAFSTAAAFGLRWFTPTREVPLCGHATMASAAVLLHELENEAAAISFSTLSGDIVVKAQGDYISLDLPLNPPVPHETSEDKLVEILGVEGLVSECVYSAATKKLLIRLKDSTTREQLEALAPDTGALQAAHTEDKIRGVMVSVKSSVSGYDFLSRYFAPWNGIPEDPVTGSAHTVLAPYWSAQLGKTTMSARQCSPRGGDLLLDVRTEESIVQVAGQATLVSKGLLITGND